MIHRRDADPRIPMEMNMLKILDSLIQPETKTLNSTPVSKRLLEISETACPQLKRKCHAVTTSLELKQRETTTCDLKNDDTPWTNNDKIQDCPSDQVSPLTQETSSVQVASPHKLCYDAVPHEGFIAVLLNHCSTETQQERKSTRAAAHAQGVGGECMHALSQRRREAAYSSSVAGVSWSKRSATWTSTLVLDGGARRTQRFAPLNKNCHNCIEIAREAANASQQRFALSQELPVVKTRRRSSNNSRIQTSVTAETSGTNVPHIWSCVHPPEAASNTPQSPMPEYLEWVSAKRCWKFRVHAKKRKPIQEFHPANPTCARCVREAAVRAEEAFKSGDSPWGSEKAQCSHNPADNHVFATEVQSQPRSLISGVSWAKAQMVWVVTWSRGGIQHWRRFSPVNRSCRACIAEKRIQAERWRLQKEEQGEAFVRSGGSCTHSALEREATTHHSSSNSVSTTAEDEEDTLTSSGVKWNERKRLWVAVWRDKSKYRVRWFTPKNKSCSKCIEEKRLEAVVFRQQKENTMVSDDKKHCCGHSEDERQLAVDKISMVDGVSWCDNSRAWVSTWMESGQQKSKFFIPLNAECGSCNAARRSEAQAFQLAVRIVQKASHAI